jgi:signal transduction histidine kinase/DNA-binding response OmpR family regulator
MSVLAGSSWAATAPVCVLDPAEEMYGLQPFLEYLEDPDRRLDIGQAASASMAANYSSPPRGHFNFGFTSSALWFRFTIAERVAAVDGAEESRTIWLFDPGWHLYDTFQLFLPRPGVEGQWLVYNSGRLLTPSGQQEKRHFQLPSGLKGPVTCYIRVTGVRPVVLNPHITSIHQAIRADGFKMLGTALLLGFFGTLMLGNLAIFIYTRNVRFIWFVLANAAFAAFVAVSSHHFLYMHQRIPAHIMIAGLVAQASLALVARAFLDTRAHNRLVDGLLVFSLCLVFSAAALSYFLPSRVQGQISIYALTPLALIMVWACLDSFKREQTVAIIFLCAWAAAALNIVIYTQASRGVLPFVHPSMIWAGLVVMAMAMAVLLAHTIRSMAVKRQAAMAMAQARGTFLASMSHEIRTPMTAVLGFLKLSLRSGATGQLKNHLQKVRSSAQHLMDIINDILDVAKIEAGKIELEGKTFELESLLGETATFLAPRAFENGNELVFALEPGLPRRLVGDPLRLKQVLINLGGNAVKFTKNGTVRIVIGAVASQKEGVALRFRIIDTGIGIRPEVLPRLFQSFEQADSSTARVYGGTGLGLNISRRLVHLMGGQIGVQSTYGQGSTFEFTALFKRAAADPLPDDARPAEFEGLTVLVVEDNPASRAAMDGVLRQLGAARRMALSVAEAVRLAGIEKFDIVLLDWDLPDLSGPQALAGLRDDERLRRIPVVFMCNAARPEMEGMEPERLGAQAILSKPFTRTMVEEALRQVRSGEAGRDASAGCEEKADCRELQGLRVLLVEDNLFNQELMTEILAGTGLILEIAGNGQEAVERIVCQDTSSFDVVLMDVEMPGMDGCEATRAVRADSRFAALPIIAMTANVMAEDRAKCLAAGMNGHLSKPVDTDELFRTLSSWAQIARRGDR